MISTRKRLQHAAGYISLGMLNEASDELEAIAFTDRFLPEVLLARIELHMEAKHWETLIGLGRELASQQPQQERAWIAWAYALRELNRTAEALAVLTEAEPLHGETSAVLHYNIACYCSLLGDQTGAWKRINRAFQMEPDFKKTALDDPDLRSLWGNRPNAVE